ncbi:MAG: preprotein translocase subunit SecG [Flavobacteriales bacterium]|jgi:preprotein translocase subunit SecG|nr:preprotein translocase subunit SecG [Flavobacteriales bacterium]NCG30680.1 preprotein translocase subunit SecG [Bacteroidota bacterium]MBT3964242.1 preprotein translocase subunit SecG [Flavobacteriales bacterium]MBT4704821.1 preprotein translocase subunit SecG [Flavobacteriales bacterium]MBT4929596.1 preprotein translocase subunit SecG [Flavobacteriales bacterium]
MIIISILIFLVSLMLMGIVLVQNSKGGGLASGFSSSNQIVGVQRTTDFLEKGTWILAISLLVLCLISTAMIGTSSVEQAGSELEGIIDQEVVAPIQGLDDNAVPLPGQ